MTMIIDAVYEAGVFRPLEQMELPEGRRVKITVDAEDADLGLPTAPVPNRSTEMTEAEVQARLEIIQSIAALAVSHGRQENASRDHDKYLYGRDGAR